MFPPKIMHKAERAKYLGVSYLRRPYFILYSPSNGLLSKLSVCSLLVSSSAMSMLALPRDLDIYYEFSCELLNTCEQVGINSCWEIDIDTPWQRDIHRGKGAR